jgi:hypothetical protein
MKDSGRANRQSCTTWSRQAGPVRLPQSAAPVRRVLSLIPAKYDDMWTGAQGFYNVKPIVADGGQVAVRPAHPRYRDDASGDRADRVSCRDYVVKQWARFKDLH